MRTRLLAVTATAFIFCFGVATAQPVKSVKTDARDADLEMFSPDIEFEESIPTPAEFLVF